MIEYVFKFDSEAKPDGIVDGLLMLLVILPIIPVMLLAIWISGVPWMFVGSAFCRGLTYSSSPNRTDRGSLYFRIGLIGCGCG